ncbi:3'(2'),5'-bisphosphate nucleotidase CysQ [Coxiella burnetii]
MIKMEAFIYSEKMLTSVIEIIKFAAKKILSIYSEPTSLVVTKKGDGSPLTKADQLAHDFISAQLTNLTPKIPIISEELDFEIYSNTLLNSYFWLVDPLDGTKDFIKRNGEFTVNIALIKDAKVVLGVVFVPVTNTCYYANKVVGAFKQVGEQPPQQLQLTPQNKARDLNQPIKFAISRHHGLDGIQKFIDKIGPCECVSMGSSLKICSLAEGEVDIYPRLGPTKEWDTAAAQCVLEQAGGKILIETGKSLFYNKLDFLNPKFLALGSRGNPAWVTYL